MALLLLLPACEDLRRVSFRGYIPAARLALNWPAKFSLVAASVTSLIAAVTGKGLISNPAMAFLSRVKMPSVRVSV